MAKASLRLFATYPAWGPSVREARYSRDGLVDVPMLVRADGRVASDTEMARARMEVKLLARLRHETVLRLDFVSAVAGRVAWVHEACDGASLSLIAESELAGGRPFPLRVCIEIAARVAVALDEATRVFQGPARVDHAGPEAVDLLVERNGRTRLAGFLVATGHVARRRGCSPPEDGSGSATMTWMAAQFLSDLIRAHGRENAVPPALARALSAGFAPSQTDRPGPAAFAKSLRDVAGTLPGPSLVAWADVPVREVLAKAKAKAVVPAAETAETLRQSPGLPSLGTLIPDDDPLPEGLGHTALPAMGGGISDRGTIIPDGPDMDTEEPVGLQGVDPQAAELNRLTGPTLPVAPMPVSFGPAPLASARSTPAEVTPGGLGRRQPALGPTPGPTRPVAVAPDGPKMPIVVPSAPSGPSIGNGFVLAPAPTIAPIDGGYEPMMDGQVSLPEVDAPPPSRTGLYLGLVGVGLLSLLGLGLAIGGVAYYLNQPGGEVEPPLSPAAEALTEPVAPLAPAPDPAPAAPVIPAPVIPAPVVPKPAPTPSSPTPSAPSPAPSGRTTTTTPPASPPEPDDTPVRTTPTTPASDPTRIVSAPATTPAPQPDPPAAPADPGPFNLTFKTGEGDTTTLEVRCGGQSGSGVIVDLNAVPAATYCRITGLGGSTPLQTSVTVSTARTYTCFANGARACR